MSNKKLNFANGVNYLISILRKYNPFFSSMSYWEKRYTSGGNSGDGSYGKFAKFKSKFINDFTKKNKIKSVIEFGCGDGNQLSLVKYKEYIGLDVSKTAISLCQSKFTKDKSKSFFLYSPQHFTDKSNVFLSELGLSLDVIYHLVEDDIFEKYMHDLFNSSKKYVVIFSSNTDKKIRNQSAHVKHRKFDKWIAKNMKNWKLINITENPLSKKSANKIFYADFYVYKKGDRK